MEETELNLQKLHQQWLRYCQQKNFAMAKEVIDKIIQLAPTADYFFERSKVLCALQRYQEALYDLEKVQQLNPSYQQVNHIIAKVKSKLQLSSNIACNTTPSMILQKEQQNLQQGIEALVESGEEIKNFGRYQIIKELGRGGMGKVYQAFDPKLNRQLALKIIIGEKQANTQSIARFLLEAQAIAKIDHPKCGKGSRHR